MVCESKPSSSNTATSEVGSFVCKICAEPKSVLDSFRIKDCSHAYCSDCVVNYVSSKLQNNVTTIGCPVPECRGSLEPEHCLSILPPELFLRWGKALCEADDYCRMFYCSFKDCNVMLIDDRVDEVDLVRELECPHCWRLFCARCRVPWHANIGCEEFQELNKDERSEEDAPSVGSMPKDPRVASSWSVGQCCLTLLLSLLLDHHPWYYPSDSFVLYVLVYFIVKIALLLIALFIFQNRFHFSNSH